MTKAELKEFLDAKVLEYNHPIFLEADPIQIPHRFTQKEDIEISAFLTATIAWGNRKSIINNAIKLMGMMGNSPYDFVMNHSKDDLELLSPFVHRTFNGSDLAYFVSSLQNIYKNLGGLEAVFTEHQTKDSMQPAISEFKEVFFELPHPNRTQKHVSDPNKGSAAKRINMFLRWMVRDNATGVDFGLWKDIAPAKLSCPLDVHSGNVARKLKLLKRKQNDAKALQELDKNLRKLDANDPVKYDFALFGLGVFERF
ncbi:TIGR02757 family protein [Allomuricauda sp. F6463D]|uniref:TIGR02757 family protein n=1 Tax=Allomuricauda sp. F6463D TaxID=2926409 RepID=UPI001FF2A92E|nr:TIGR02757 family protein [Muricauda sp. F6463D]MCK0159485.1 TIGR02757 family protein [Muricauda sp. F6463D]